MALAAFGILLLAALNDTIVRFGLLPFNEPFRHVFAISSILHVVVLNFAIITQIARFRQEKYAAEAALASEQQRVEQQRQFLRLISHELRIPLAIIDSTAQILPLLRHDPEKFDKKTTAIQTATRRMKTLLDTCLTSERLSMDRVVLDIHATDIRQLLRNVVERIQTETGFQQISFIPDGLPNRYACDPMLLEILIGNLLDNAVKYSPDGASITLRSWTEQSGELTLEVRDQGVGISPDHAGRIFERFYRAGQVPGVTGAGLGLYLVQHIAELHGGTVSCSSSPGQGSTFSVMLHQITA